MTTDTSEKGLESLIVRHMTGTDGLAVAPNTVAEPPAPYGGTGYFAGSPKDFDRAHALDVTQLFAFLRATQPEAFKKLAMADAHDAKDGIPRGTAFMGDSSCRLQTSGRSTRRLSSTLQPAVQRQRVEDDHVPPRHGFSQRLLSQTANCNSRPIGAGGAFLSERPVYLGT